MYALTECQGGQIILTCALSSKISCYTSWWIDFTIVKWIWKLVQICNLAIWHVHCPSFDNCNKYNWKFAEIHFAFDCALSQKISCYTSWLGKPCFEFQVQSFWLLLIVIVQLLPIKYLKQNKTKTSQDPKATKTDDLYTLNNTDIII